MYESQLLIIRNVWWIQLLKYEWMVCLEIDPIWKLTNKESLKFRARKKVLQLHHHEQHHHIWEWWCPSGARSWSGHQWPVFPVLWSVVIGSQLSPGEREQHSLILSSVTSSSLHQIQVNIFMHPQIFLLLPNIFSSQAQFSSDINASLYALARGVSALGVNDGCFGNLIPGDSVYIAGSNR